MSDNTQQSQSLPNGTHRPSGSISGPSPGGGAGPTPNPRSCVTCRRRKVKCDKKDPCSNCLRAKIDCIFPGPGRAPRKSRKPPDAELLERLRRLEGVVTSLNAQVEGHEQEAADREKERHSSTSEEGCPNGNSGVKWPAKQHGAKVATDNSVEGLESRFGRLVVENGRSRYINNSFWASLNNEVEDLKAILIEEEDDDDDAHSPDSSNMSSHQGFIFGYNSSNVDMHALHPPEPQARQFWEVYKENVESLVKVLHIPTFEPTVFDAFAHPDKVSKGLETLLFAVYYGAVTSSTTETCLERWGEDRATLLNRYRFGLEQALARANFLYCDEVIILQSFVIFLVLMRRNDDARKIWTLTGLVVRIAQTLGIHRDGSHFGLPPFEIEMRRRLWWQICILDARSSEDHGCDPTIVEAQFDTKMPLNVNDIDIHPDMTEFPEERQGFTDMTFCLLRFEIAHIMRRIAYIPPGPARCTEYFAGMTIEQKEKWITECHQAMENKYLKNCDMTIPICWVTATISRLIMSKMWLIVYHPYQRKDGGATLPQETKDKLFITSLENVEYSMLLETEARTMKWGWLFRTYVQWHAIAFLLSELCVRTKGEAVERAWRALEATAGRWWFPLNDASPLRKGQQGTLWKPLRKLLTKARAARERELALERASLAIRSGQFGNSPFSFQMPSAQSQMNQSGVTTSQQDADILDSMLRPAAPKLGDMPSTELGSWPNSPTQAKSRNSPLQNGDGMSGQRQLPNGPANGTRGHSNSSPGKEFGDLFEFGLDNVINDVMGAGGVYDGTTVDFPNFADPSTTSQPPRSNTTTSIHSYGTHGAHPPTKANGYPTFGDGMLPSTNMDFSVDNTGNTALNGMLMGGNGQQQQVDDAVMMDNGDMDWTLWDDMVTQYGHGGNPSNPASTALVNWF
ncbi:uncharacterized protein J4E87_004257 [Alternaria ethzedia]|uniref:uncharacterized protein n=1 Tax=Alternaria ethzedia TaxID=181014 RepID=UPI0020C1CB5C|nr:uncharacterized protein J4E87_004257 [Alternaria ethzedia]KAI4626916.1 hypothetical protein J4E87_004257 [Alternaria ethzedia]